MIQADPLAPANSEEAAYSEIVALINMIYDKRDTVKNICWKIYRFYVWGPHLLNEDNIITTDNTIIEGMADTMIASGYKIQPVIDELLRSQHFYEAAAGVPDNNIGAIIKSPLDLVFGTLRLFDVQLPNMITEAEQFYAATADITEIFGSQGLSFYEPYDVAGYDAYHQFPVYHRFWITPNYLVNRYDFIKNVIRHAGESTAHRYTGFHLHAFQYRGTGSGCLDRLHFRITCIQKYLTTLRPAMLTV